MEFCPIVSDRPVFLPERYFSGMIRHGLGGDIGRKIAMKSLDLGNLVKIR